MYTAYRADGTAVKITHLVDFREALSKGLTVNPPGTKPAKAKKAEPEGEKVSGIEAMGAVVEDEKDSELEIAKKKDHASKIHRK